MKLDTLKINGYKSIKNLEIKLKNLNILIGANGVGKSNFIGFFKFINKLMAKDLQLYTAQQGGANKILHFGAKTTNELSFYMKFADNAYSAILQSNNGDNFIFKKEKAHFNDYYTNYMHGDNIGGKETILHDRHPNSLVPKYVFNYMKQFKIYHFHDTGVNAKIKQTCNINNCDKLEVDGSNLSAFLLNIQTNNKSSYDEIIETIKRVAPFFKTFILNPQANNKNTIMLKWAHKGSDEYFDVNDLSDGTLRFMCLATLLLQPNLPTIILLDEPELGLHPFALKLLASMFRKISLKTQIIIATQSATLADEFDINDIIVVDKKDNCSTFKRLDEKVKQ